jgi:hypothetical protein
MAHYLSFAMRRALPAPRLGRLIPSTWHGLFDRLFDSYRPERHYMRGPGPKWHAKHPDAA